MTEAQTAKTGTTTVGIVCTDGVVMGADTRATLGRLIGHKAVQKLFKINDRMAMTVAGSVGDAQALVRRLRTESELYEFRRNKTMSVHAAATSLANLLNAYKFAPFYTQLLLGGVDDSGGHVYSLDAAGGAIPDKYVSTGSGSIFVYGVLEDRFHDDITVDEAIELAIRGINAAMNRDSASGNSMRIARITADGGYEELDEDAVQAKRDELGLTTP